MKKLKKVVEDLYRKRTELAQPFLVDCCKITNESIAEEGHIFPFKVGACNTSDTNYNLAIASTYM